MLDFFKRPKVKLILIGIAACISVPLEALTHNCLSCRFDPPLNEFLSKTGD